MTVIIDSLDAAVGCVISEAPFVKLLTVPKLHHYEVVPGMAIDRWEALAQVNECLAMIELKVSQPSCDPPRVVPSEPETGPR